MKFRNTLILVAIAAALLVFVLLVERKQPTTEERQATPLPTELPVILYFETDEVQKLQLARPESGQRTELVRGADGQWQLTAPLIETADQEEVDYTLESLAFLQPSREITGTLSLADYGLEPAVITATVELADGTIHTVRLGEMNPAQSGYYAQVDDQPSVFLVPAYTGSQLGRLLDAPPVQPTPTAAETPTNGVILAPTATP
jgi:hypothetical protein